MSFDSDEMSMPGYFLPEDSQSRLKKLHDQIAFLARLAQPRSWSEQDHALEMPMRELTICLESLAEQVTMVLDDLSWPAQRQSRVGEGDVAPTESPEVSDAAARRFAFGLTRDQFDTLERLIQTISSHGDVVACRNAELANDVGQAFHDRVKAVRAILDKVETQELGQRSGPRARVGEERAVYRADFASPHVDGGVTRLH